MSGSANAMRWDSAEVKARQAKAIALKLEGKTLEQIVDAGIGFTSTSGASQSIKRGLEAQVNTNAQQVINEEVARLDSLIATWFPKAIEDDPKAALLVVKFMDRRARYLGLDFMDGIAERHVQVQEAQVKLAAELVRRVLGDDELGLTDEQKQKVPAVAQRHLSAVA